MKKEKTAKTEKNEKHWERVTQEFAPVCDADCRVLILGTAPSKKSREVGFYYGHPQNRFWKMLAAVTGERVPQSIAEKKALLLRNHIALHDVIHSCDIIGSSDSSHKMWSLPIWSGFLPLQAGLLSSATAACPINYIENIRKADSASLRCSFPRLALPMRRGIWSGSLRHGVRCFCPCLRKENKRKKNRNKQYSP